MEFNEFIVDKIQRGEDREKNITELYEQNKGLCHKAANKFAALVRNGQEDLEQEASLAFILAVDSYDPDRGVSFASYAYNMMEWQLIRYIQDRSHVVRLPAYLRDRIRAVEKISAEYAAAHGTKPDPAIIAQAIGVSTAQVETALHYEKISRERSLNAPISDDSSLTLEDVTVDPDDKIESLIEDMDQDRLSRILWGLVDDLGDQASTALRARFQEGKSLNECAETMGMTRSKVIQTINAALRDLRKPLTRRQLDPYVEARAETLAYKFGGLTTFNRSNTSCVEEFALWLERREHRDDPDY